MDSESIRRNLLGFVALLRRRWPWAGLSFIIVLTLGALVIGAQKNPYQATSVVVLRNAPEARSGVSELLSASGLSGSGSGSVTGVSLDAAARELRSHFNWPAAAKLMSKWKSRDGQSLSPPLTEPEYFAALAVDTLPPDQLLVRGISENRLRAEAVAEVAARVGVDASVRDARADWERIASYAQKALPQIERDMNQSNRQMAEYQRKERIWDATNSTRNLAQALLQNIDQLNIRRAAQVAAQNQLAAMRRSYQREAKVEMFDLTREDPVIENLRKELSRAHAEYIRARADFLDEAPELLAAQEQVTQAEKLLKEHVGKSIAVPSGQPNSRRQSLFAELIKAEVGRLGAEAEAIAYADVVRENQHSLEQLATKMAPLQGLAQRSKVKESSYMVFLAKLQDAMVNAAVQPGNLRLVDLAGSANSVGVPRSRLAVLAALVALVAAYLVALLVDLLVDTVRSPHEAQQSAGAPVLGALPVARDQEPALALLKQPNSPLAEAVRMAVVNLKHAAHGDVPKTILVTSPNEGDGKTTTAANLALAFARAGQSTVLVDANLRAPGLDRVFANLKADGLTDLLLNGESLPRVTQAGPVDNLKIIPAGTRSASPPDLLGSARMARLLDELRASFEVVIVDSPALLALADSRLLAARADATLIVTRSGRTQRSVLAACRQIVDGVGGHLAGVIINHADASEMAGVAAAGASSPPPTTAAAIAQG